MNPATSTLANPALSSMKDIQLPEPIGLWPLAYGYWILIVASVCLLITLVWFLKQRYQKHAPKRAAIKALMALDYNDPNFFIQVNSLLKRAAMSYLAREHVASLEGEAWYCWLETQVRQEQTEMRTLLGLRFKRPEDIQENPAKLQALAKSWMQRALPLSRKQALTTHIATAQPSAQSEELKC